MKELLRTIWLLLICLVVLTTYTTMVLVMGGLKVRFIDNTNDLFLFAMISPTILMVTTAYLCRELH